MLADFNRFFAGVCRFWILLADVSRYFKFFLDAYFCKAFAMGGSIALTVQTRTLAPAAVAPPLGSTNPKAASLSQPM